jgi:uncharacterized protein YdeI (YjbR/CyaY-like superfamily)
MNVTATVKPPDRDAWRAWLVEHHGDTTEIWILYDDRPEVPTVAYVDAVEEALCFGWIDSTQKRLSPTERAQRFSPRRRRSSWSALNRERARRLIRLGLMTEAGRAVLPDLTTVPPLADDVVAALKAEPGAWERFLGFPELYRRIRLDNLEAVRADPVEFERRLERFVAQTAAGKLYGNWNDGGRLG